MSPEPQPVALLICFALKEEAAPALPLPEIKGGSETLITGIGPRNASTRFSETLTRLRPGRVLTCGFAGALNPSLKLGDVLFDEDPDAGFGDTLQSLGAIPAKIHCADRVAVTTAQKSELRRTTGADAVEMESAVIRTLCRERGIPSATIRVVSDTAAEDLPLDFNALMTADQKISIPKLATTLLKSPGSIPRLLALQKSTGAAARRLAGVLHGLLHRIR